MDMIWHKAVGVKENPVFALGLFKDPKVNSIVLFIPENSLSLITPCDNMITRAVHKGSR